MFVLVLVADSLDALSGELKKEHERLIEIVTASSGLPTWTLIADLNATHYRKFEWAIDRGLSIAEIETVGDLYAKGPDDLLGTYGVGPKVLQDFIGWLWDLACDNPLDKTRLEHWFVHGKEVVAKRQRERDLHNRLWPR